VEGDLIESLTPYLYKDLDGNNDPPQSDWRDPNDTERPYYGPVFWIIFEELLPQLTYLNGLVLVSRLCCGYQA
jgi:hypothetical protein